MQLTFCHSNRINEKVLWYLKDHLFPTHLYQKNPPPLQSKAPLLQSALCSFLLYLLSTNFLPFFPTFLSFEIWVLGSEASPQMGCAQSCSIESNDGGNCENDGKNQMGSSRIEDSPLGVRSVCRKMKWGVGLIRRSRRGGNEQENNKAWLLAESGAVANGGDSNEPHSMHSSFRFSFGSQVELESLSLNSSAATVLLVNLDKGGPDPQSRDLRMRRIESLERNISSVSESLVRFSYAEICSATGDFCKGQLSYNNTSVTFTCWLLNGQ